MLTSKAAVDGKHPTHDLFGKALGTRVGVEPGSRMHHRWILTQIKADWMEMASSIGLPQWGAYYAPCPVCACRSSNMFCYDEVTMDSDPWGERVLSYDAECKRCEIPVEIASDAVRNAILIQGGLHSDPNKQEMGRVLTRDIPELRLFRGDRLEPSSQLRDTSAFETAHLPFWCVFWRQHRDARGRLATFTLRRNPVFQESLGTSPAATLHLDSLHTYIGVFQFYCHSVILSVWKANMFKCTGAGKAREVANLEVFFSLYKKWCREQNIPLSYQLGQLHHSMVGAPHLPGMKTKAAETGVLMRFCVQFCRVHRTEFCNDDGGALLAAGEALESYMNIIRTSPFKVAVSDCRQLLFLCLRFLTLMQRFGAKDLPKGHLFVHVSKRVRRCGNPRMYSTFWDEGLNLSIATMASSSYRSNWHDAIFTRARLLPHVQKNSVFALV